MSQKSETPHNGGVSRKSCAGHFHDTLSPLAFQVQFLIAAHNIRPELATMIAALAFGGHGHG